MRKNVDIGLANVLGPGELRARFQPIVDLSSGTTTGFEILARWVREDGSEAPPSSFVPLLEQQGIIGGLTPILLTQAFRMCQDLPSAFGISINISPLQLHNGILPTQIGRLARAHLFNLSRLTIEVTESAYFRDLEQARSILIRLKDLGAKLSLDDFGTGYSSLSQLQALPFDEVKVDRSFVSSMTFRRDSRTIVAAIVGLGRSLGLTTVGEGIEQSDQAEMLRCLGCERGQGWLFGRPLLASDMSHIIAKDAHHVG